MIKRRYERYRPIVPTHPCLNCQHKAVFFMQQDEDIKEYSHDINVQIKAPKERPWELFIQHEFFQTLERKSSK